MPSDAERDAARAENYVGHPDVVKQLAGEFAAIRAECEAAHVERIKALEEEFPSVERIEMEDWSAGYRQPAEPEWRVVISGYCANFPTETAANNFRNAILARLAAAKAEGRAEMREEAAQVAERYAKCTPPPLHDDYEDAEYTAGHADAGRAIAEAIRALPTSPAPASEETQG